MRFRLQPRVDFGEIGRSADGSSYARDADMYLRRIRLEVAGKPLERLRYALIVAADRWGPEGQEQWPDASLCPGRSPLFQQREIAPGVG